MTDRILWGDLHSHCNISYGWGSLSRALSVARQQLDFVSVTGHASWPDMPTDEARYAELIRYHQEGFAHLREGWPQVLRQLRAASEEGRFVTFPSFEWHSIKHGDYHVLLRDFDAPLASGDDPATLARNVAPHAAILIPHHIGYGPEARGIDWETFDAGRSPVVEMISSHGSSEADESPRAIYHTMGPRVHAGTVQAGLQRGHRFSVVGGTDHHGGYPGHHGAGRTAVLADTLTRDAIWSALKGGRCYAVTGDKIHLDLDVNGAGMGQLADPRALRRLHLRVLGRSRLDRVEVFRNGHPIAAHLLAPETADVDAGNWLLRIEWGWGERGRAYVWDGCLDLTGGEIIGIEPTFRGNDMLDPRDDEAGMAEDGVPHEILARTSSSVHWRSTTYGNPHPAIPGTSGINVEIHGGLDTRVTVSANGMEGTYRLSELRRGSRRLSTREWLEPALHVHRPVAPSERTFELVLEDGGSGADLDYYTVRVGQTNDQWAWSSPIWVPA